MAVRTSRNLLWYVTTTLSQALNIGAVILKYLVPRAHLPPFFDCIFVVRRSCPNVVEHWYGHRYWMKTHPPRIPVPIIKHCPWKEGSSTVPMHGCIYGISRLHIKIIASREDGSNCIDCRINYIASTAGLTIFDVYNRNDIPVPIYSSCLLPWYLSCNNPVKVVVCTSYGSAVEYR